MVACEEEQRVHEHRFEFFKKLLGKEFSDAEIEALCDSVVSPHDIQRLLEKGCSAELAFEILI